MDPIWTRCCVAGAGGLCGKPVRDPVPGMLGMCDEHRAHGVNCWCGMFFLASNTPGRVVCEGAAHTAFACGAADESAHNDATKEE